MKISNKNISKNLKIALAPMAGITDSAFRLMNVLGGADLVYSEMAHVNAISYNSKKTLGMLKASPFEFPYVVQLFGKDPQYFAKAAEIISTQGVPAMRYKPFSKKQMEFIEKLNQELRIKNQENTVFQNFYSRFLDFQTQLEATDYLPTGQAGDLRITDYVRPSGLDINLGCPAKKVFGHGGGAALWKDLKNVRAILEAVIENTELPVSIKVRTAVGKVTLLDLLDSIQDLPIKSVMIHGRTYAQGFSGPIDAAIIKKVIKKYPQFEFWVNGGIIDQENAQKAAKETGCTNLGIARGTYGNPLLAEEIKSQKSYNPSRDLPLTKGRKSPKIFSPSDEGEIKEGVEKNSQCLIAYIHSLLAYQSKGKHGIVEMRKHLAWYFKDFPGAKDWRRQLVQVKSIKEIENILGKISKTELDINPEES